MTETARASVGPIRRQTVLPGLLYGGNTTAAIVLLLVTLIAAQDFYLADYDSALALKGWWVDASFHITSIDSLSALMQGRGLPGSSEMGAIPGFYHFLSYVPAAPGCVVFGLTPIKSFALIYAPLALFLFGFAIWLLAASCWSKERALWATVLFLLLPDLIPYLTSSHDFLRLKWLVSVSPGLGYGVFVSALAWVLCLRGIRTGRPGYVALGWLVCLVSVLVKAQLFVANALPLVVYTIAFYPALQRKQRGMLLILFLVTYVVAIRVAGNFLSIPLIRLDFSTAAAYAAILANFQPLDGISSWLLRATSTLPVYIAPFALGLALLFVHFGALLVLTLLLLRRDVKQGEAARWLPALAVFAVYVLHAVGLAHDTRPTPYESIELLHRPFTWGVSLIMVWTFASLAVNYPRVLSVGRRWALCALLLPPGVYFYHDMQFAPRWPVPSIDYSDEYFEALGFLEHNAERNELVQAADLDPYLAVQAATGRAAYVAKYAMRPYPSADVLARSDEVLRWLHETDTARIASFAAQNQISWLLVRESTEFIWPSAFIAQRTMFKKNSVLVLRFLP